METTNTENKKGFNSKTVFIEYSSNKPGQHFITVMKTVDGKRRIIGRIYREYDKENKKMNYTATDHAGNQIFKDSKDLTSIKKNFKEQGHVLAMSLPKIGAYEKEKELKEEREMDVNEIRARKASKNQERGIER